MNPLVCLESSQPVCKAKRTVAKGHLLALKPRCWDKDTPVLAHVGYHSSLQSVGHGTAHRLPSLPEVKACAACVGHGSASDCCVDKCDGYPTFWSGKSGNIVGSFHGGSLVLVFLASIRRSGVCGMNGSRLQREDGCLEVRTRLRTQRKKPGP